MRSLDLDELDSKIHEYALEIEYFDIDHLQKKLKQFIVFLEIQPISQRILERIKEDYAELKEKIPFEASNSPTWKTKKREVLSQLNTPLEQGAFGYFLIDHLLSSNKTQYNSYLYLADNWYDGNHEQWKDHFNTFFFKSFVELLNWYISESRSRKPYDYFSKEEVNELSDKIDDLKHDIQLGQNVLYEVLSEELEELKRSSKNLNKKNWKEQVKGKLVDLVLNKIITTETFKLIYRVLTDEDLKFLPS